MRLCVLICVLSLGPGCSDGDSASPDAASTPAVDAAAELTWEGFAAGFFTDYCFECHGPGDELRDYSIRSAVEAEAATIRCGVAPAGETPPGCAGSVPAGQFPIGTGAKPTDEERRSLVRWIDDGMP